MTISWRIVANLIVMASGTAVAVALVFVLMMERLTDQALEQALKAHFDGLEAAIEMEGVRAESLAGLVAGIPIVQETMARAVQSDASAADNPARAALAAMFEEAYPRLAQDFDIRQFQFHLAPALSFYRVHKPKKFGDDLSGFRRTVLEVNETAHPIRGIEKGVAGLGLRGVVPVFQGGASVGSVEFGLAFGADFWRHFADRTGLDVAFHLPAGQREVRVGAKTVSMGDMAQDGVDTIVATGLAGKELSQAELATAMQGQTLIRRFDSAEGERALYAHRLYDYKGDPLGVVELVMDAGPYVEQGAIARSNGLLAALAAVALASGLGVILGRGLARPVVQMTEALCRVANRDFSGVIPGQQRRDELGEMARAVSFVKDRGEEIQRFEEAQASRLQEVAAQESKLRQNLDTYLEHLVESAVQCNEGSILLIRMIRDVEEAAHHSEAMASAIEEMVASIRAISSNSDAAAVDADSAGETARSGVSIAGQAQHAIQSVFGHVQEAATTAGRLGEASAQIGEIIGQIENIAAQTNLLALNATIEAARAGEAGRGFAVVAGEVKNLAGQTGTATEDIRNRIDHLRTEVGAIIEAMQAGSQAVDDGRTVMGQLGDYLAAISGEVTGVTTKMQDIAGILSQQTQAADEVSQGTTTIVSLSRRNFEEIQSVLGAMEKTTAILDNRVDEFSRSASPRTMIETAKNDHIAFKRDIYNAVIGRKKLSVDAIPDHHSCRLGRWYDSIKHSELGQDPDFIALDHPHAKVHDLGRQALLACAKGDRLGCVEALDALDAASHAVITRLSTLSEKYRSGDLKATGSDR